MASISDQLFRYNDSKMLAPLYPGFLLPPNFSVKRLTTRLDTRFPLILEEEKRVERVYLDTFDWRLHAGGVALVEKRMGGERALMLRDSDDNRTLASVRCQQTPAWPSDIPSGELRNRVAKLIEMRVLLPLVKASSSARVIRVLNEDEKTVVRLHVEEVSCVIDGMPEPRKLLPRLRLVPVRGYDGDLQTVTRFLREELEVPGAPRGLIDEALVAVGREPGDYSSKFFVQLNPNERTDAAARKIFLHLLGTLERNIDGTKADLDSEFLHDLRVATRRTRSALTQIKGVLPTDVLEDFKQRFGWLGQVTGPTRDMDVFLLELPKYRKSLPHALRDDLEPFHDFLVAHQRKEQHALRRKLNAPHFRNLIKDWRDYLGSDLPSAPEAPNALRRVQDVSRERIWKMFRRVLKEGRAVDAATPNEALHELRKSCKKLRYLIEFFASLQSSEAIKPLIKALKALLDNLGEFQDLEVQAHKLQHFAELMQNEGEAPMPTLLTMGALVGDLLRHQERARTQFEKRFHAFDTKENRDAYRRLFKPASHQVAA